jgi:hypothetical protein
VLTIYLPRSILAVVLALNAIGPASTATQQLQQQPPANCGDANHRQFDFWVGDWDVFSPDGKPAGRSHIESFANGCGIEENWTGAKGGVGRSLNTYDASDHQWHQFWVGTGGSVLHLTGNFANDVMTLQNGGSRIRWTRNADGTVRQVWDISSDGGQTWKVSFDGKYVRAAATK